MAMLAPWDPLVLKAGFNPNQPRDPETGQWVEAGTGRLPDPEDRGFKTVNGDRVLAYHGTMRDYLDGIMEKGLSFEAKVPRNFMPSLYKGDRGESIYVTDSFENAEWWARHLAIGASSRPDFKVILRLEIPKEKWAKFIEDRRGSSHTPSRRAIRTTIDPSEITRIWGFRAKDDARVIPFSDPSRPRFFADDLVPVELTRKADTVIKYAVVIVDGGVDKYDPNQPRWPAGDNRGGQWRSAHGVSDEAENAKGREPTRDEREEYNYYFPELENFEILDDQTREYNCAGDAFGDTENWWWPGGGGDIWVDEHDHGDTIKSFDSLLIDGLGGTSLDVEPHEDASNTNFVYEPGYTKLMLFAKREKPTHIMRMTPSGKWRTKVGSKHLVSNDNPFEYEGRQYGEIVKFYKVPTPEWRKLRQMANGSMEEEYPEEYRQPRGRMYNTGIRIKWK